jgi:hypothetical protein
MQTPLAELARPPVYRHARQALARWLEPDHGAVGRRAFRARAAIGQLDAADRHQTAGWPAWLLGPGQAAPACRLRQLNGGVRRTMQEALNGLHTAAKALTPAGD